MKLPFKFLVWLTFLLLLTSNVVIFLHSIKLGDEINHFEKEISKLHQENLGLENQVYEIDSLQYATSIAAELNFTKKNDVLYLENLKYARNN